MDWIKQVDWGPPAPWVVIGVLSVTWFLTWLAQRRARYGIYRQELYRQRMSLYGEIWQLLIDAYVQARKGNQAEYPIACERLQECIVKNFPFIESSVLRPARDFMSPRAAEAVKNGDIIIIMAAVRKVGVAIQRALALEPLSKEVEQLTKAAVEASKARPAAGSPGRGDLGDG